MRGGNKMEAVAEVKDGLKLYGFSRVQIEDPKTGKIVGDSGWCGPNQVTNLGIQHYLSELLGNTTGSVQVGFVALGTGSQPAAADTTLQGEQTKRSTAITVTISSSKTVIFTATFNSGLSFVTATKNISNIGLFNLSSAGAGSIFAGNSYASSSCATNQNVNTTYEIRFS